MSITPTFSRYVFGIDLGTTNSVIAVHRDGRTEAIPLGSDKSMPSVVRVLPNGDMIVGKAAKPGLVIATEETVANVKRHLGTPFRKTFKGLPDKEYSASDLSAEILSALTTQARQSAGLEEAIHQVVICVPANFHEDQRQETIRAAEKANLQVLALLEEPSAAAIAYALDRQRNQTILVYDLGGGTFDVSVLKVESDATGRANLQIKAKGGVSELGGIDFDRLLMEMGARTIVDQGGPNVLDLKSDQGISRKALLEAQSALKEACQSAKEMLTESENTTLIVSPLISDESGRSFDLVLDLAREDFERSAQELVDRTIEAVRTVLSEAGLTEAELDRIVLAGGSTRMPMIRKALIDAFGMEPYSDADPDTIVARGAAIYAASLANPTLEDGSSTGSISILDKVTHYLGVEANHANGTTGIFSCLLEKGADIPPDAPLRIVRDFRLPGASLPGTAIGEVRIAVYQADSAVEYVYDEDARFVDEIYIKCSGSTITVAFEIDQQNLLKVSARTDTDQGGSLEIRRR